MRQLATFVLLIGVLSQAFGQTPTPPTTVAATPAAVERFSTTKHSITVAGKTLAYTATAGTLVLKNDAERPTASVFFVAYTRDDASSKSKWPITFTFNGGPGSSSVWLHMGAIGRNASQWPTSKASNPPRLTNWWTTKTRRSP